jgi:RiboL-PSP-HEPN
MIDEQHEPIPQQAQPDTEAHAHSEAVKMLQAAVAATFAPYIVRMKGGLQRLAGLILVAKGGLSRNDPDDKATAEDILRAAVVLIHAHLEDFLRTLAGALLPAGDESCLNGIPLAGVPGRPEKFLLGKLVQHKGKLVDDVLRESVSEYLERRTFNDTDEISGTLEALGVDISKVNRTFPDIQRMMKRRHQIVHRADRIEGNDPTVLEAISPDQVEVWIDATTTFLGSLLTELAGRLLPFEPFEEAARAFVTPTAKE